MSLAHAIQELKKENLCTYFILPILRLNKFSFGGSNFIDSYLTKDCKHIAAKVYDSEIISRTVKVHAGFVKEEIRDGYSVLFFKIPPRHIKDVITFKNGQYSKLPEEVKNMIYGGSGLDYKVSKGSKINTDLRLLALVRHQSLFDMWEKELDTILGPDDELLEPPGSRSFIDF